MTWVLILSPQADEMMQLSAWLLGSVSEEILERSISKHTYPVFDLNVSCVLRSQWFYVDSHFQNGLALGPSEVSS